MSYTLSQFEKCEVHVNTDAGIELDKPFRVIYTEELDNPVNPYPGYIPSWHFLSWPWVYRPMNFSTIELLDEFITSTIINKMLGFDGAKIKDYKIVQLHRGAWRLVDIGNTYPVDCDDDDDDDDDDWGYGEWDYGYLIYDKDMPRNSYLFISDRIDSYAIANRVLFYQPWKDIYVCGMTYGIAKAIIEGYEDPEFSSDCRVRLD